MSAVAAFPVQQSVLNNITGDRVRIRLGATFRRVRWPFRVLILEQRWKKTNNQFFLVIGPEFHWWSKGSIWFPWHWSPGKNAELEFSRSTVGGSEKQFCVKFKFSGGPEWTLGFTSENFREKAYQALLAIRECAKSRPGAAEQTSSNRKTENKKANENADQGRQSSKTTDIRKPKTAVDQRSWHEVLGVAPDASVQEITIAYRDAIKKCHPDTVADRSELIKQAAATEAKQINVAYRDARTVRGF